MKSAAPGNPNAADPSAASPYAADPSAANPNAANPNAGSPHVGGLGPAERKASLDALANGRVDLVVIGGGVTGAGCALDAAARGLSVVLLEQNDIAAGTSSRSSKLIHGGLRYLEQWRFGLVREALRERSLIVSKLAPHLVSPVPFLYLLQRSHKGSPKRRRAWLGGFIRRFYVAAGVALYDLLARIGVPKAAALPRHQNLSAAKTQALAPSLDPTTHRGGVLYWDAQTDDARYTLALARTAAAYGAHVLTSVRVTDIATLATPLPGADNDQVHHAQPGEVTVQATDRETGQQLRISAAVVINATGVWSDDTDALAADSASDADPATDADTPADPASGTDPATDADPAADPGTVQSPGTQRNSVRPTGRPTVRISKGVHLVIERDRINSDTGLVFTTDTSVLFIIPWPAASHNPIKRSPGKPANRSFTHWIVGTTDTDWQLDRTHPAASQSDIGYLLTAANKVLAKPLSEADVCGVYAGLRPLITGEDPDTSKLSREHSVTQPAPLMVSIKGGKYTTYRVMAADAVDAALRAAGLVAPSPDTANLPLVGAQGWSQMRLRIDELAGDSGLNLGAVMHLLGRHGDQTPAVIALIEADSSLAQPLVPAKVGCGYLRAEVVYAVRAEAALHLDDVLTRRTRLSVETHDRAVNVAGEVGELMAAELGWTAEQTSTEVRYYVERVAAERASQTHDTDLTASAVRIAAADARQAGDARAR